MRLAVIGFGNMGSASARAYLSYKKAEDELIVYDRNEIKLKTARERFSALTAENEAEAAKGADYVLFAVEPKDLPDAIRAARIINEQVVISVAAGVTIARIEEALEVEAPVVRVMPNVSLIAGEGMSALCGSANTTELQLETVKRIFASGGRCTIIKEEKMDAVGALSGSSPAYAFMFIESLAQGGILCGMSADDSYEFAAQTVLGAAKMLLSGAGNPAELRDSVTSPGGTTIEGVRILEENGFRAAVINAVKAAFDKTKRL